MEYSKDEFQTNIDYKKIVQRFIGFRNLYIFFIVLFLIVAFLYNKMAKEKYENTTTILISDTENSPFPGAAGEFMGGMSFLSGQNNIDNEIEVLQSFTLVKQAIQRLELKSTIFSYENSFLSGVLVSTPFLKKVEHYNESPIKVVIDPTQDQASYLTFTIKFLNEESFQIEAKGQDVYLYNYIDDVITSMVPSVFFSNKYKFGEEIKTKYFSFIVLKTESFDKTFTDTKTLGFHFNNLNFLAGEYQSNLSAEAISQKASIIRLSCRGSNYYKVSDFVNSLSSVFLDRNLQKKNTTASSTVSFIDAQISEFADSLQYAETDLKNFRTSNKVMDISFQGQQVFEKLDGLETEKANLAAQKRYYSYLQGYFNKNKEVNDLLAPSSMNVVDPILTNLVGELLNLNAEKGSISRNNVNSENILLQDLNVRIENLKRTIREIVNNSLNTIDISIGEIDYRIGKLTTQISAMPKTELQLKGIERKFELNSAIYTFLLQKRSEAQIARASSMPDYEIIEPARTINPSSVSPKRKINYIIALFLGLVFPTSYIFALDFFNNRINDIEEIEALAQRPILGKVYHNSRKTNLIVAQKPHSSVSESFRAVRTNFQFFDEGGKKQVILFTSSASGDGKTFCAINFASVLALNGHKTALLEFDLRRPKVHQEFGSSNMIGISSYLIEKAIVDDVIIPTEVPNLDLISAGPAAPNPAELIASDRTPEFLDKLKEMYDYIVIDSAPVGIVSETFLLMKHSDVNIFVVRMNITHRDAYKNALKGLKNNKFQNFSLLINDLNIKKEAFKYGYDNKYYMDDERGFFKKLFSRNSS